MRQLRKQPSRWLNVIVASSNFYAIRALNAWQTRDTVVLYLITAAMTLSILYHLIEHHKHYMPGCGMGTLMEHRIFLNMNRVAAALLGLYLLLNYFAQFPPWQTLFGALAVLGASEFPHYAKAYWPRPSQWQLHRIYYVVTHSLWHLWAFHIVYTMAS